MNFNQHAYFIMKRFEGIRELAGAKDNPVIVAAHKLCGIYGKSNIDEIPWCSSSVNLCMVLANIERNPQGALFKLQKKGFQPDLLKTLFGLVGLETVDCKNTLLPWIEPTFSADSKSWDTWAKEVPRGTLQIGDLVRLSRDGGGHIAFYEGEGKIFFKLYGGNQNNEFCSSEKYVKTRFVTARRFS